MSESTEDENVSLNDRVFELLRDGVANREFSGFANLSETNLRDWVAGRLESEGLESLSKMPVRRAIARLESAGILKVVAQKGTQIRILSSDELREVWQNRVAIEEFVLTRLARKRKRNLLGVLRVHGIMRSEAEKVLVSMPTSEFHQRFSRLDEELHEQLAIAAGFPDLADGLNILRLKLKLASPVQRVFSPHRYLAIVNEHQAIIDSLGGHSESLDPRPDINAVRLAFLIHMKNSSRDSWKINQKLQDSTTYGQDYVFDVPELANGLNPALLPVDQLFQMRHSTECCAVAILAAQPGCNLQVLESIHSEMKTALAGYSGPEGSVQNQSLLLNLDISFHSALCFSAGMLFGEEVVGYTWHKIWFLSKNEIDLKRAQDILNEHEEILNAIRMSQGGERDIRIAVEAMESHVFGSFVRNNFDRKMLEKLLKLNSSQRRLLKKLVDAI